jgi:hypothetical protein
MKKIIVLLLIIIFLSVWFYFYQQNFSKTPNQTPTNSAVPTITLDAELIRQALAKKYNKSIDVVDFSLAESDGTHARGGVKFVGDVAGAWVLATKVDDQWIIIQDGNGTVSCELVDPYSFPISMVSECVNNSGKLIKK